MNLTVSTENWPVISSLKFQFLFGLMFICTGYLMLSFSDVSDIFSFSLFVLSNFLGYIGVVAVCALRANSLGQSPTLIIAIGLWLLFSASLGTFGRSFGFLEAEQITLLDGIKKIAASAFGVYLVFLFLPWPMKETEYRESATDVL